MRLYISIIGIANLITIFLTISKYTIQIMDYKFLLGILPFIVGIPNSGLSLHSFVVCYVLHSLYYSAISYIENPLRT